MTNYLLHIVLMAVACAGLVQCNVPARTQVPTIPIELLQEGDIVFRRGYGFASEMVVYNDADGKYSHVGVVVNSEKGLMIAHSVPGGDAEENDIMRLERIEQFYSAESSSCGEIVRMELDSLQRRRLSEMAVAKANEKIPFDHNYDLEDTTALYCTELVQLLYRNIGIDLAEGRITRLNAPGFSSDYLMPSDIYQNRNLKTIFKY
ncbi:MAG: hypothetical protein II235_07530 [Muribaculaceae bacterium]|nr:hypothetical protein [Muribaculaceae bacterium]MEE1298403.1 YiiX/YebB-like N1pC/P60 family cysteine hydrolase [Muribaculaceae bacterium]